MLYSGLSIFLFGDICDPVLIFSYSNPLFSSSLSFLDELRFFSLFTFLLLLDISMREEFLCSS